MSIQFLYKDGEEAAVDECGRPEPMDYVVDEKQYRLETLSPYTQCLTKLSQEESGKRVAIHIEDGAKADTDIAMRENFSKRNYTLYIDQDKARSFKPLLEKCLSVFAAAKQLASTFLQHKDGLISMRVSLVASSRNIGRLSRPCLLDEEHKRTVLAFMDENPSAVWEQVMEQLGQTSIGFKVLKSTLHDFVRKHCNLSLKKAQVNSK